MIRTHFWEFNLAREWNHKNRNQNFMSNSQFLNKFYDWIVCDLIQFYRVKMGWLNCNFQYDFKDQFSCNASNDFARKLRFKSSQSSFENIAFHTNGLCVYIYFLTISQWDINTQPVGRRIDTSILKRKP